MTSALITVPLTCPHRPYHVNLTTTSVLQSIAILEMTNVTSQRTAVQIATMATMKQVVVSTVNGHPILIAQ